MVASGGLPGAGSPSTRQGEPLLIDLGGVVVAGLAASLSASTRGWGAGDPALGLEEARDPGPGTLYVKTLGGSGPWQLEKKKVSPEPKLAELTV